MSQLPPDKSPERTAVAAAVGINVMGRGGAQLLALAFTRVQTDDKMLSRTSLGLAIVSAIFSIVIVFAAGMSHVADEGRRGTLVALPVAGFALLVSIWTLITIVRRKALRRFPISTISAVLLSAGILVLVLAALRSYG